ncbi:MAG: hypothetical protein ACI8WT_003142 [Clostridium sp.]|jgi:hypothetical protein
MYGMTESKINKAKYKIKCNKAFMNSHGIELDDKIIPFAKFVSNSYINPDRYIAELQHRAHSINDYATKKDLSNIFLTLTLPSVWHPMKQKSKNDKTLIFNKKFGGRKYIKVVTKHKREKYSFLNAKAIQVLPLVKPTFRFDYKNTINKYSPKNASAELSRMYKKIQDTRQYKSILKDDRCYFRVTEPHKDGTPHLHISLFVPHANVDSLVSAIKLKYNSYSCDIVLNVDSPVHYLMKYVLKTLDDLREDNEKLTALSLWYVYHGISRFYTSRTFLSLDIYRKLGGMYSLNDLKESYDNSDISIFFYSGTKDIAKIDNEHGTIYTPKSRIGAMSIRNWNEDMEKYEDIKAIDPLADIEIPIPQIVNITNPQWRQDMENEDNTYYEFEFDPIKFIDKKPMIDYLEHNDKRYVVNNGLISEIVDSETGEVTYKQDKPTYTEIIKKPYQMKNYELARYFENIDLNTVNPDHYAVTTNLMIERGLIVGERLELNLSSESSEMF